MFNKLIDRSPRQLYRFLRRKLVGQKRLHYFDDQHLCVFVLSTGRVGTQTLSVLLGLADNVFSCHEPKPYLYGLSKSSYQYSTDASTNNIVKEAFLALRKERLDYALSCGKGYIETSPQTTFLAPAISIAIPSARFIHLVRHPQYVVRSAMRRQWYGGNSYDASRITPRADSKEAKVWNTYSVFQKNLWLWNETNRRILEFTSTLPAEQTLLIHAEDIFNVRGNTINKLFSFINAPLPSQRKLTIVLNKKFNAQKTGVFPKPSDWTDEMYSNLSIITGDTARILGYKL